MKTNHSNNEEVIFISDLDESVTMMLASMGVENANAPDEIQVQKIREAALERLIEKKLLQQEAEKTGEGAISLSLQSVAQIDVKSRIQSIGQLKDSMLLAVYGEKDDLIDPNPARELDGQWDNVRPIGLSESKHFPMLDETAKFNRLLKDFLDVEDDLSVLELKEEWRRRTR